MLLSATGLSVVGLLGKLGLGKLSLTGLIFWRFFASFIICLLFVHLTGRLKSGADAAGEFQKLARGSKSPFMAGWGIHLLRAFFVLSAQYSFFYYIQHNPLMNGMVLLNTGPLLIPLIEWGVMRNKVGRSTWIGVIVSFVGVLCVLQPDSGIFSLMSLVGLFAGISQGASQVVFGITAKSENPDLSVLYLFFFSALLSLVPYLLLAPSWVIGKEGSGLALLLILSLGVASVCNQIFRAVAYQHGTPSRLSPFFYVSVLLGGLFDWTFFGNIPNTLSLIGAGLVILGGVLKICLRFSILRSK